MLHRRAGGHARRDRDAGRHGGARLHPHRGEGGAAPVRALDRRRSSCSTGSSRRPSGATSQRHERLLLEGLFDGHGDSVELSDLKNEFYRSLGGIKTAVTQRLVDQGYYRAEPATVRARWRFGAIFAGFVTFALGGVLGAKFGFTPLPFMVAGVLIALIIARHRSPDAGAHGAGHAHAGAGARVRGVPVAGGEGELRAGGEDAGDVRAVPALRDGVRGGADVGQGVQGHRARSRRSGTAAATSTSFDAGSFTRPDERPLEQRGERDVIVAAEFGWIGLQRWRVIGWRWWRRGRGRVLGS